MELSPTVAARIAAKTLKTDTCWLYQGYIGDAGYGILGNKVRREKVHRVAYVIAYGPIPDGLTIDHSCRVRSCVRPAHLRLATVKQNNENRNSFKGSEVPYRGVCRVINKKLGYRYRSTVFHNGKYHNCGTYDTPELAAEAARLKRLELFTHATS